MKCADTSVMECETQVANGPSEACQGIIHFPAGLLGFEDTKRYQLLGSPEEAPFLWLQMEDEPRLAFLVVTPATILADYHPDICAEDAKALGLANAQDAIVLNIVTMHRGGGATVNLKGPIVVNRHALSGKQVIPLNSADYSLQHPLPVAQS